MAVRGWRRSIATAVGVAAGAGATQLGFGYGLDIIAWMPATESSGDTAWAASLAWAIWTAATSTVVGALGAERLTRAQPVDVPLDGTTRQPPGVPWRFAVVAAAAFGALVTVLLVAVPARAATRADGSSPQSIAAGYAVLGVLAGMLMAFWALTSRTAARNVVATGGWLWLTGVAAVIEGVVSGREQVAAPLGFWQVGSDRWFRDHLYWPAVALSLGSALLIGVLAARRAPRRERGVETAASGAAGPLLVAVAYLLTMPRLGDIDPGHFPAHLVAPYAVLAGLAGSMLVAALAQRAEPIGAPATDTDVPPADPVAVRQDADGLASRTEPVVDGQRDGAEATGAAPNTARVDAEAKPKGRPRRSR